MSEPSHTNWAIAELLTHNSGYIRIDVFIAKDLPHSTITVFHNALIDTDPFSQLQLTINAICRREREREEQLCSWQITQVAIISSNGPGDLLSI